MGAEVEENHNHNAASNNVSSQPLASTNCVPPEEDEAATAELEQELSRIKEKIQAAREAVADKLLQETAQNTDMLSRIRLKTRRTLGGHAAAIYAMSWRPESRELVSGSQDGKLLIWDTQTNNKINMITLACPWIMSCGFSQSGNFAASGGHDNAVSVFSLKSTNTNLDKPIQQLTDHTGFISSIQFLDDSQLLCSSGDNTCALWNIDDARKVSNYEGHTAEVMGLTVASDNSFFLSGSCDRSAKLWDMRDKSCRSKQSFSGHDLDINSISLFPSNRAFATGSDDNSCKLFDIRSDQAVATYSQKDLNFGIAAVNFSKSGRLLFVACDFDVLIWDTLKSLKVGILSGHENRVSCLGVNSEGNAVASGSWDSKLKIWN